MFNFTKRNGYRTRKHSNAKLRLKVNKGHLESESGVVFDYYYGLQKIYFRRVLKTVIKMADLELERGIILDFGCGFHHLKKMLPKGRKIVGYDIVPTLSDVKDYRGVMADTIVANQVLNLMTPSELNSVLLDFMRMKPRQLIVGLSVVNWFSRFGALFFEPEAHVSIMLDRSQVFSTLEKLGWKRTDECSVLGMTSVSRWICAYSSQNN